MSLPVHVVDAFTAVPFRGNPAAVVVLDRVDVADEWLADVAAEMNLSETAFVAPRAAGGWDLRWFTPTVEVELCGHATLASAHVLFERGDAPNGSVIDFHTRVSGVLTVAQLADGRLEMDFPVRPPRPVDLSAATLAALGGAPVATLSHSQGYDLVVYATAAEVRDLAPDHVALRTVGTHGVIVTAPSDVANADFVSRYFAPGAGIDEDPVTGSAHCVLAPYWCERLDRSSVVGLQVSRRTGIVECELRGDRVLLRGHAITTLTGRLEASIDPMP
jgi:PhzF family phenazine biosynthesis protein